MLACVFVWVESGLYVKLEAVQAWRRGFCSSAGRQVAVLIVSLAGQEPAFFVEFTSAVDWCTRNKKPCCFVSFDANYLPIEDVCGDL
jgi:hypothetical protein